MLEKPDLPDSLITSRLHAEYGLPNAQVVFLPLGVDVHSAAYRVNAGDSAYFLKLRRGLFDELSVELSAREPAFTLCHGDLHPGNLFLSDEGNLYIVDWDDAILAPKEHDLMMLGAGMGGDGPRQVELFHQGYGPTQVDRPALTYYRYERVVRDLAAFGEQVFSTRGEGEDLAQAVAYFKGQFEVGNVVEAALGGDEG
jgi:hypothetical protein